MGCLVLRIEPSITHFKPDSPAKTTLCRIWAREPRGFLRRYCKRGDAAANAGKLVASSTSGAPRTRKQQSPPRAGLASGRNRGISVSGRTEVPRNSDRPSSGGYGWAVRAPHGNASPRNTFLQDDGPGGSFDRPGPRLHPRYESAKLFPQQRAVPQAPGHLTRPPGPAQSPPHAPAGAIGGAPCGLSPSWRRL